MAYFQVGCHEGGMAGTVAEATSAVLLRASRVAVCAHELASCTMNALRPNKRAIPKDEVDDGSSDSVSFDNHRLSTRRLRTEPGNEDRMRKHSRRDSDVDKDEEKNVL
jgi:hypothetical protein